MTIREIVANVRYNLDDKNGKLFTQEQAYMLYQRSIQHIRNKLVNVGTEVDLNSVEKTWSANSREVELARFRQGKPVSGINVERVVYVFDTNTDRLPVLGFNACLESRTPAIYIRREVDQEANEEIIYAGYYVVASTALCLTLYYIPRIKRSEPGRFRESDLDEVVILSPEYHNVLINYMTMRALGKDEINASFWFGVYQESLTDALQVNIHGGNHEGVVDVYDGDDYA